MRTVLKVIGLLVVLAAVAFALGPRVSGDTTVTFDPSKIGPDPAAYLAAEEAKVVGIRPGQQKQIVWAGAPNQKTPLALVYVHGFSASSGEVRPLPDKVAKALGANLFFTRLSGHGQDGADAMAQGSVPAWANDYAEALAIGRTIGDHVIVLATSTGGSLAVAMQHDADVSRDIDGYVLISPNFGVQAGGAFLLTLPWGKQMADLIVGPERSFEPRNEKQAAMWTTRYPTVALLPMQKLVDLAAATKVEDIKTPALFIISENDKVVRPEITKALVARWGGPYKLEVVNNAEDPDQHVISGDALSPNTTDELAGVITDWIRSLHKL